MKTEYATEKNPVFKPFSVRASKKPATIKTPLYIIDGDPVSEATFQKMNPDGIASITILKDTATVAKYGDSGRNGVLIITTKKAAASAKRQK
ncbi:MAG: hypothetical protein EOO01_06390 [Chitinophagaceae bacterium]|nr:MAG: hypothetical protein EOO01_06390 [Chitinophagaceae bacterium]